MLEVFEKIESLNEKIGSNLEFMANGLESGNIEPALETFGLNEELDFSKFEDLEHCNYSFEKLEIVTDLEMKRDIVEYLSEVEELKYDNWCDLSSNERVAVLNKIEESIAKFEHRPALKVEIEELEQKHLGYQDAANAKIVLNSEYVNSNEFNVYKEVIDTIIHEGRHAYQHYNVDVRSIHESESEVKEWEKNFYDSEWQYYSYKGEKIFIPYADGQLHDVGFRLYANQPVEIDARKFASDVILGLEEKDFFEH